VLAYSTASPEIVQPQPAPGSCHALGGGSSARPDPRCTPGALNPAVTQATIGRTICHEGWTSTVRPPETVTEAEKAASMAAYGDPGPISAYEYDHLVPLELGGALNDPRNLWPEPGASPNRKDAVEDALRAEVCDGRMPLARAQRAIASDWARLAGGASGRSPSSPGPAGGAASRSRAPAGSEQCSASASYNSRYDDYDVYVHSDQPEQTATVSDGTGHLARWHTDETGYADVYFRAPAGAAGETINVRVGGASCQATLIP
jgi:hypothetical protein